ncbi:MAG: hypothetical protein ACI8YQ_004105, partial [Polaribacter sp.]
FCLLAISLILPTKLEAQPANDLCSDAVLILTPSSGGTEFSGSGSTLTATTTDSPPSCGSGVDNSTIGGIWYKFEGESSTLYSLSTCDPLTDFDTEISVHSITGTGSCMTGMDCLGGNDNDASCSSNVNRSTFSITTPAGSVPSTYYVYVTGEGTATGTFQLSLTDGPPLPVELISFAGDIQERSNRLSWKTASEFNTERYVLERSIDGKSPWAEIGYINAVGFSNEIQEYDFEDLNPVPKAYYRLRSSDFDGHQDISKLVYLERTEDGFDFIDLVPNPTRDFVRVQFNQISNGPVTFTLMNIQGQILRQWSTDVQQGDGEEQIDLSELNKGLYFIQLNNGVESISKRVLRL